MHRLTNPVRHYDWGSQDAIPRLLGVPPDGRPQAELWLGAHPQSPSLLPSGQRLDVAIQSRPEQLLGADVRRRFGDRLPFLVKVLAAATPLSVQTHPDAARAAAGYAAEEAAGIATTAPNRRYQDPFHKPEMLLALGPFEALCGFRPPVDVIATVAGLEVEHPDWPALLTALGRPSPPAAIDAALGVVLGGGRDRGAGLVDAVLSAARHRRSADPYVARALSLAELFPGDPGVLVSLLMNHVPLQRGDALLLRPGDIHAYLEGIAIEVMAASDNVLRAGLTTKYVDEPELREVVDTRPATAPFVTGTATGSGMRYRPDVAEFDVVWLEDPAAGPPTPIRPGPRIALVLEGELVLGSGGGSLLLRQGESAFVAAADGPLTVTGDGTGVVVGVPAS